MTYRVFDVKARYVCTGSLMMRCVVWLRVSYMGLCFLAFRVQAFANVRSWAMGMNFTYCGFVFIDFHCQTCCLLNGLRQMVSLPTMKAVEVSFLKQCPRNSIHCPSVVFFIRTLTHGVLRQNSPLLVQKSWFPKQQYYKKYPKFRPIMHRYNGLKSAQKVSQQMYRQAFEPFSADGGTVYPCSQSEIDFHHRGKFLHRNEGSYVSAIEATSEIVRHNKETRNVPPLESAAIDRLIDAILDAEEYGYCPDMIVKAFADLDLVFFNGRLRGNVCVQWASDEYFQQWHVPPGAWGFTVRPQPGELGQCRVKLNAKTILLDPSTDTSFKTMVGTMLHEMCHAYEHVRCFPEDCDQGDGHDKHFRTKIHAVHRRAHHLLGLWAIDKREAYREDHFMSQNWSREWRDTNSNKKGGSRKHSKSGEGRECSRICENNNSRKGGGLIESECVMM